MCTRALADPTFPKYPVLPVRVCRGVDPVALPVPPEKDPP